MIFKQNADIVGMLYLFSKQQIAWIAALHSFNEIFQKLPLAHLPNPILNELLFANQIN